MHPNQTPNRITYAKYHALRQRSYNFPLKVQVTIGSLTPERCDFHRTLKRSHTVPPLSSAKSSDCCLCGRTHTESLSRHGRARQAPTYRVVCGLPSLGRWFSTTKSQTNTTGVRLQSTVKITIMEMPSNRHFSLRSRQSQSSSLNCSQQAPFYTQPCAYSGERTLSTTTESRTTPEFQDCNFGHRTEPSRPSSEASRDSCSIAKSNSSIVPFTRQRFNVSYRILCFELETDGSFRWLTRPYSPCFCLVKFIQSHSPFPCMHDLYVIV